ncbi:hypothetical protein DET0172 [Dehalococcoides mccartyi 195]|uniref:Uncharacterized protein n=1 Tax=Dehalococcoides mccartyi (strain ATCC BAA-2266 / KCTC 15142 / 195) TaxID=243164 RepID=Q3ZA29_DEHM1|nr:hypothetical protein DET0172 [Dehalococcoides mccartyi 195]
MVFPKVTRSLPEVSLKPSPPLKQIVTPLKIIMLIFIIYLLIGVKIINTATNGWAGQKEIGSVFLDFYSYNLVQRFDTYVIKDN